MVQPVPEEYGSLTPHVVVNDANAAIEFYKKAFGAEERCRMPGPDGKRIMHVELKIGSSILMMCDEFPEMGNKSAKTLGGSSITLHLYVPDVDAAFAKAVEAGCTVTMPVMDMFWG